MTDDTKNCDEVSEWLEEQFPEYLKSINNSPKT